MPKKKIERMSAATFFSEIDRLISVFEQKRNKDLDYFDSYNELIARARYIRSSYQSIAASPQPVEMEDRSIRNKELRALAKMLYYLQRLAYSNAINKKHLTALNNAIVEHNRLNDIKITFNNVRWQSSVSEYGAYTGTGAKFLALLWLSLTVGLDRALMTVGLIFTPVIYAFIAIKALFDASSKAYLFKANRNQVAKLIKNDEDAYAATASKFYQYLRVLAAAAAFVLNFVAAALFALVLVGAAYPILPGLLIMSAVAWAVVAAATFTGWLGDAFIPTKRAEQNANKLENKVANLLVQINTLENEYGLEADLTRKRQLLEKINDHKTEVRVLRITAAQARQEFQAKKTEMIWGFRGVLATILTACAPIPVVGPVLSAIGYSLLAVVGVRGVYVAVEDRLKTPEIKLTAEAAVDLNETLDSAKPEPTKDKRLTTSALKQRLISSDIEAPKPAMIPKKPVGVRYQMVERRGKTFLDKDKSLVERLDSGHIVRARKKNK